MHRLQQHIMQQLITHSECRYADLKPREVEGNLFMYHLKHLIADGLVAKGGDGRYRLTAEGKAYVDRLSLKSFTPRIQPRIVTLMAIQDDNGRWLMYRRKRQPLLDRVGFPYGKIHLGETVKQAAERELKEKTGLVASLTHRGDGYSTIYEEQKPISEILFHLFYGKVSGGKINKTNHVGEPFWTDAAGLKDPAIIPTVSKMLAALRANPDRHFFLELTSHI
jgi:8-oxo-dGTP diphosphatase